jgi:hypothetical protein
MEAATRAKRVTIWKVFMLIVFYTLGSCLIVTPLTELIMISAVVNLPSVLVDGDKTVEYVSDAIQNLFVRCL